MPAHRIAVAARLPRWAWALTSGVFLTLIYPPFDAPVLAWIALAPLFVALEGASPRAGALLGWLTGTLGALGVTGYWIFRAAHDYFGLSAFAALAFTLGVTQLFVSPYFMLFGLLVAVLSPVRWRWLIVPILFVATEYLRAHVLSGNPWALLGHSQTSPLLMGVGSLTGVYGLSFTLALVSAAVVALRHTRVAAVVAGVLVAGVLAYGSWQARSFASEPPRRFAVALVQGNLPNAERGLPEHYAEHLDRYVALTQTIADTHPALVIWPENAVGFFPDANPRLLQPLTNWLRTEHTALLTGAPRGAGTQGVATLFNSAYLFTAGGAVATYDKRVLLPFVERFPLRRIDSPFQAGTEATIFSVDRARFGVLICYEAIYPQLARELVNDGAELLVNISNDSWFEAGAGPEQHNQIARFRAVENGVSLVRVTNSGISGAIDPLGRQIARLPEHTALADVVTIPLRAGGSFYTRHGDVFAGACIAFSIAALIGARLGLLPQ